MLSLVAVGCGDSGPPKADVSGKVALDGQPLTGVSIRFTDANGQGGGFNLDADGSFVGDRPLKVGEYRVSFSPPWPVPGDSPEERMTPEDESDKLPTALLSAGTSGLTATVTEDSSANVFEFSLSSKAFEDRSKQSNSSRGAQLIEPEIIP
jgi:hypothetical protein